MPRCFLICFLVGLLVSSRPATGQPGFHWVFLADKDGVTFDPFDYLDPHAIGRRMKHNLPLFDHRDLPVRGDYLLQIRALCDSIDGSSRWFNAAIVLASEEQVEAIRHLPFVTEVQPVVPLEVSAKLSLADSLMMLLQTERLQASVFRDSGYTGKGVRVAIFDVGFPDVDTHPAFKHIHEREGIVATRDFTHNNADVYGGASHGTAVLSCIAGMRDSIPLGLATDAEFLLARTERLLTEWRAEEHRWVRAAEWADKHGADIISSSLGYTFHHYFRENMDGKTAIISCAANIAASKGILVINSAGNEGTSRWQTIGAPADADSVLAVGGTDPFTDASISFSSIGPTADLRLKPNVCAFGQALTASRKDYSVNSGTSFACPLVAGFAACAMQARPDFKAMETFHAIEQSGHLYPYFDYAHGYGIPQAERFLGLWKETDTTFHFSLTDGELSIVINDTLFIDSTFQEERYVRGKPRKNLYYRVMDEDGQLQNYGVILVHSRTPLTLFEDVDYRRGQVVSIHYERFTDSITIE